MKKLKVLMTTMEYDAIKVGGLSAALTSMAHALKEYINPLIILPRSGRAPDWKKIEEKNLAHERLEVYEHDGVTIYALSNQILDVPEVYPEPADEKGIRKIDEFSRRLVEVVDDVEFDVVHMQDFFAYKAMNKFKSMNKPVVLTIHRLHREYPTWFSGEITALDKADYVTVVGKSYYEEDEKELFRPYNDKTTYVFNGVDTEFWNAQASTHSQLTRKQRRKNMLKQYDLTDGTLLTYVGRFDPVQKGVDILLKASEEFLETKNARMIIVGVGDRNLEKDAKGLERKYPSRLRFVNQLLPRETVRDIYSSADFALVPSIFEPFGLVQLEAMACECIPIGSRTGGIKDTVISYDDDSSNATGILVEKGKPTALLEGMRKAMKLLEEKPESLETLRKNARKRCETVFQWSVSAKKYSSIYEKLLNLY